MKKPAVRGVSQVACKIIRITDSVVYVRSRDAMRIADQRMLGGSHLSGWEDDPQQLFGSLTRFP